MVWGSPYAWFYISHGVLPGFNNQQLETQLEMKIGTSNVVFWLCVVNHDPLDVGPFLPLLFWIVLAPQACFVFSSWHFHCATFSFRQLTTSNQSNQVPVARSLHLQNLWVNNWKNPRQKPQSSDLPVANLVFGGQSAANCPWKNGYFCITWILPENDVTTESDWCFSSVFCFVSFKNWDTIWIFLDVPGNAQWLHGKMWRILGLEMCFSSKKSRLLMSYALILVFLNMFPSWICTAKPKEWLAGYGRGALRSSFELEGAQVGKPEGMRQRLYLKHPKTWWIW